MKFRSKIFIIWFVAILVGMGVGFNESTLTAEAMVEREYTLQEVIDSCIFIVFGKVTSVDQKRKRAIFALEEELKGKSPFKTFKMNVAVGDSRGRLSSPKLMMEKLAVGAPVIFFYRRSVIRPSYLKGLGHVSGTWFQMYTTDTAGKGKVWWNFTHIEAYMHRTYKGSTENFRKVVRAALAGKKWPTAERNDLKVLVLTGNMAKPVRGDAELPSQDYSRMVGTSEFFTLKRIKKVKNNRLVYEATKNRQLPELHGADILWVGRREFAGNKYFLTPETENQIKRFVHNGGLVIITSQDSDRKRTCPTGWLPEPLLGMELLPKERDFHSTPQAGDLFRTPNKVRSGKVCLSDTWTNWNEKYTILATTANGQGIAVATLQYGKGLYIITSLDNRTEEHVRSNKALMENLMFYAIQWLANHRT